MEAEGSCASTRTIANVRPLTYLQSNNVRAELGAEGNLRLQGLSGPFGCRKESLIGEPLATGSHKYARRGGVGERVPLCWFQRARTSFPL